MELNNFELDKLQTQLMAKNKMLLSRDTLGSIIKSASDIEHKQEKHLSNREAFDEIIERTLECESIMPKRALKNYLEALETFLSNWGFFDEVDDDTE